MKHIIAIGLLLGFIRIFLPPTDSMTFIDVYKDIAHIYVGVLGTLWWIKREAWMGFLFVYICAVEVATAVLTRL